MWASTGPGLEKTLSATKQRKSDVDLKIQNSVSARSPLASFVKKNIENKGSTAI